jgi:hypothetical protein
MKKWMREALQKWLARFAVAAVGIAFAGHASAIVLVLTPSVTDVSVGGAVNVDVTISGLNSGAPPSVGAFDLDVSYDPAVLNPTGVTFGPFLGNPALFEALTDFNFLTPGIVDFAEVSLLSAAQLDAMHPSSFRLATLSFLGIANGTSAFALVNDVRVDDAFGVKLAVPEPATALLMALGLLGLVARLRSR